MGRPNTLVRVEDALICAGIEPMVIPQGGAHVRAAEIRIPAHFSEPPAVTGTVHAITDPAATGSVFGIFNIKVTRLGTETQVVIQATNVQAGQAVQGDFVCDYVIIGNAA